jgi:stage II sporulation protein D
MGLKGTSAILLTAAMLVFLPGGCRQDVPPTTNGRAPIIRVKLLENQGQVLVGASSTTTIRAGGTDRRLNFPDDVDVPVTLTPQGWQIGSFELGAGGELVIEPESAGSVRINKVRYRGQYRLVPVSMSAAATRPAKPQAGPRFDVFNDVDVESYLKGVLAKELPNSWSSEAFKAQAIAARTYAIYEMRTAGATRDWDVYDDTRSQVYGGIDGETDKSRAAADGTAGIVAAHGARGRERIFKAYFSSCCGGIGQSAADALGDADIPPLAEKYVGALCNASRHFNWDEPVVIRKDELTRRIRAWGARRNRPEKNMAALAKLEVAQVNQYNRPVRFVITDVRGARYSLNSEETRWACNADAKDGPTLRSSFFKPINERDVVRFAEGHGFGHGVGLCQWCTQALAQRGVAHEDIVRHAYPGALLVRAY